jgi:exodeoxyribonuclease VII small subunit
MKQKLSYSKALAELREMVEAIENNEVPLEELLPKMEKAQELLAFCREQLRAVEEKLQ